MKKHAMIPALECRTAFLFEEQTESYIKYGEGVPEKKMRSCAKSSHGVACSAGQRVRAVRGS